MPTFPPGSFISQHQNAKAGPADAALPAAHEAVTRLLFPAYAPPPAQPDLCVILGSRTCGYRVDAAVNLHLRRGTRYLVSGGGLTNNGLTEAAYMAERLAARGVPRENISIEDSSLCTTDNLLHIKPLLQAMSSGEKPFSMILVTAGFHMRRTLVLAEAVWADLPWLRIFPLPAYGPHTAPDNWHRTPTGRQIVSEELAKLARLNSLPVGVKAGSV